MNRKLNETPIAIIGMAAVFPQSLNLREFWDNIVNKTDCITDVPEDRWKIEDYYDPDPTAPDKTYCKRGGFIPDIDFDPMEFGLPPNILEVTDVSQMIGLVVARDAMKDAGYADTSAEIRDRTGVVLGVGGGQKLITPLTSRLQYPVWRRALESSGITGDDAERIMEKMSKAYIRWEENSFPGMLGNVIAGRIANRLDLGGMNAVVDAACASSMGAMKLAISDLVEGRSDMMISGGVDTDNSPFMYMCFSKTPAFTRGERPRPFDAESDGMMVGEGVGMIVLKRLADAERDGDRIYAVIRGLGASSDGRYKSIYAPRGEGQEKALDRAYEDAAVSPMTIGLLEAHGTGTVAGDETETSTIVRFFNKQPDVVQENTVALGSVKSQIGHTKAAAGIAGLIKVALALHHKVLPATINVETPNPKLGLDQSPVYLNTQTRPWIKDNGTPRRAGVSSFGFGGTNYHYVLEEYTGDHEGSYRLQHTAETVIFHEKSVNDLSAKIQREISNLQANPKDAYVNLSQYSRVTNIPAEDVRIGFVAGSPKEALDLLQAADKFLNMKPDAEEWVHPKGIFYRSKALDLDGNVVALFSGQGSQYVEMGRELALNFPEVRESYAKIDRLFKADGLKPVSDAVYPTPAFTDEEQREQDEMIRRTDYVQPAIGALSAGLFNIFRKAGFQPDFVAGHSFGELTALWAAGVLSDDDYYALVKARGLAMAPPDDPDFNAGTMMAVTGDVSNIEADINGLDGVYLANNNSSKQVVLAGAEDKLQAAKPQLEAKGYNVVPVAVAAAFHTPMVGHAQKPFAEAVQQATFNAPQMPVYSNASAQPYPAKPEEMQQILSDHILQSVQFRKEIEQIYEDGGQVFIEFGPRSVLTNLVKDILAGKPHIAIALNASRKKDSDHQFREALAHLRVLGLELAEVDPYNVDPVKAESAGRRKGMSVQINAGAYISDKTRNEYQETLNDPWRVSTGVKEVIKEVVKEVPVEVIKEVQVPAQSASTASSPESSGNGGRSMTMENALAQFSERQSEILRAHQQYLENQAEYIRAFSELAGRQQAAMQNGGLSPDAAEQISRSLDAFHQHQAETLRVHETYLQRQAEQTDALLQAMRGKPAAQPLYATPAAVTPYAPPDPQHVPMRPGGPTITGLNETVKDQAPATEPVPMQAEPAPEAVEEAAPTAEPAPAETQPPAGDGLNVAALSSALLDIVSDKTGYPTEMLELDMDVEADLGIDSIKRVEILGAMRDQFPQLPQLKADELAELRTLQQIVDYMGDHPGTNGISAIAATPAPTQSQTQTAPPSTPTPAAAEEETPAPKPAPAETQQPAGTGLDVAALSSALLDIVSDKTGYPTEMLELDMDVEADLGIDSIKRVEILGAMRDQFPQLPQLKADELAELRTLQQIVDYMGEHPGTNGSSAEVTTPAPEQVTPENTTAPAVEEETPAPAPVAIEKQQQPAGDGLTVAALSSALLDIVSDKTGYPTEMLELDMDVEADLGIDSIKRVEILGAMRDQFPQLPQLKADELAELRTLQQIVDYMGEHPGTNGGATNGDHATEAVTDPKVTASTSDAESARQALTPLEHDIPRMAAQVRYLPEPDYADLNLPDGSVCIVTDDGTDLTNLVAGRLRAEGNHVVILGMPSALVESQGKREDDIPQVNLQDESEAAIESALESIMQSHGPVAAFIHINPPTHGLNGSFFAAQEKALVKIAFLIAKHLKPALAQASEQGDAAFVTVARMDGKLGASENDAVYGAIAGGLFGLVKSLNLEWPQVFCRAVDLSASLSAADAADKLLAELHDPNRLLVEVGVSAEGRHTLTVMEPV